MTLAMLQSELQNFNFEKLSRVLNNIFLQALKMDQLQLACFDSCSQYD
jgi:hypothetical protein